MDRTGLSGAGAGKLLARLRIKEFGDGGDRYNWWELPPTSGSSTTFCYVSTDGVASRTNASGTWLSAPVCFRIS